MTRKYVLTKNVITHLLNRGQSANCPVCEQPLKVGEKVVSRQAGNYNTTTKHYHESCYENLFVEC